MLDAEAFEACFVKWAQHLHEMTQGQLLAIDGKTVRRSHDRRQKKELLHFCTLYVNIVSTIYILKVIFP